MTTYTGQLTDADLRQVHTTRAAWMSTGLSTERCDRPAAEAAVAAAYVAAGRSRPAFVWMDSPLGGVLAVGLVRLASDQLRGQLGDQLGGQLWDQLWDQLRDQLRDQLWDQLWGQLRDQLGDQLRDQLGDQLRDQLGYEMSAWTDAYWLALYTDALKIAGLPPSRRLDTLAAAVQACGWWWPLQGVAVLTDRPTTISRDPQGRLHHDSGPALTYTDGYTLTAWHGTNVPADFHTWTLDRVLSERNTEIRRCGIERVGWDQVEARLIKVAEADDPGNAPHKITLYDLPRDLRDLYDAPARMLLCTNGSVERDGTRRRFGLPVPVHHTDPVEAAASLVEWTKDEYLAVQARR